MTRRQEIIAMLEKDKMSIFQIANIYRTELSEIMVDIEHIKYSIKPKRLKKIPSLCKHCGFVFEERTKIKTPTKCPKCRSEWISDALFYIE